MDQPDTVNETTTDAPTSAHLDEATLADVDSALGDPAKAEMYVKGFVQAGGE